MMADCVFYMEWFELPNELQKYFVPLIMNLQKPVYYHGFNVAKLDLQKFIKVIDRFFHRANVVVIAFASCFFSALQFGSFVLPND